MLRSLLARLAVGRVSLLLTGALILMISDFVATDGAFSRAEQRKAQIDAQQTSIALSTVLRDSAARAGGATSTALQSIVVRSPGERLAAALLAGHDTVLVTGQRAAFRDGITAAVRVEVPDTAVWTLVVAHESAADPMRVVLWILSISTVLVLGVGLIRERSQAIRMAERSAELERLYSEVARANTAKSEFLANISHELRTPLNAIVGFVELLKDSVYGELSPRQVPPVDRIAASANHLRGLVDQVLDIAKIAAGWLEVHP